MGFIRNVKSATINSEAQKAAAAGSSVFTAVLNSPSTRPDLSGAILDWADMIEAVESAGWVLTNWSAGADPKGRPQAYPLFRRA